MSDPRRISAIRRLYLAKLEHMPSNIPYEDRCEGAKRKLDEVLGPMWREEVKNIGLDPTGGADMDNNLDSFYDRLSNATRDEGYHGDDSPHAPLPGEREQKEDKEGGCNHDKETSCSTCGQESKKEEPNGLIAALMKMLHGSK